jgi:hypothetical protein
MDLENIIILKYAKNNSSTVLFDAKSYSDKRLIIDYLNGIWSYDSWKDIKIGKERNLYDPNFYEIRRGVIGVYNRNDINHLNNMINAIKVFTANTYNNYIID